MNPHEKWLDWASKMLKRIVGTLDVAGVSEQMWHIPPREKMEFVSQARIVREREVLSVVVRSTCLREEAISIEFDLLEPVSDPDTLKSEAKPDFRVRSTLKIVIRPTSRCTIGWTEEVSAERSELCSTLRSIGQTIGEIRPSLSLRGSGVIHRCWSDRVSGDQCLAQLEELIRRLLAIEGVQFEALDPNEE